MVSFFERRRILREQKRRIHEIEIKKRKRRKATGKFSPDSPDANSIQTTFQSLLHGIVLAALILGSGAAFFVFFAFIFGLALNSDQPSSSDFQQSNKNIIAVKETSSRQTVGILSNPKGKPSYLYVPPKKEYEVTYEENGVLKTKTLSRDPTK